MMDTPQRITEDRPLWERLAVLAEAHPQLADVFAFYRGAWPVLQAAQAAVPALPFDEQAARLSLQSGRPLLVDWELPFDPQGLRALFLDLCRVVETLPQAEAGRAIRIAVEQDMLDPCSLCIALAAGKAEAIEEAAVGLALDAGLLRLLAQNSLRPALRVWSRTLQSVADLSLWQHGNCPVCGSLPALAELRGKERARYLRCTLCAADWPYPRLQCALCGQDDYRALGLLGIKDAERRDFGLLFDRVVYIQTCSVCRGYLKMIVTYSVIPADLLSLEDLATMALDLAATSRGFARQPRLNP